MELRTERLILRPWAAGDEVRLADLANNRKIWINLRDVFPHPYTLTDAEEWIEMTADENPVQNFALTCDGRLIGGLGLESRAELARKTMRLGYWLGEPYWGMGYATEAVRSAAEYAFATFEIRRIEAGVLEWNPSSARVLEKAGFVLEGRLRKAATKDDKTVDVLLYALVR